MLTRSLPFLPIISPRLMYLERLLFTFPRTSLRNRWRSCSIFCPTAVLPLGGDGIATARTEDASRGCVFEWYQRGRVQEKPNRCLMRCGEKMRCQTGSKNVASESIRQIPWVGLLIGFRPRRRDTFEPRTSDFVIRPNRGLIGSANRPPHEPPPRLETSY